MSNAGLKAGLTQLFGFCGFGRLRRSRSAQLTCLDAQPVSLLAKPIRS